MDDLTPVRELEADTPPLTEDARLAARHRLLNTIGNESRQGIRATWPRRLVLRIAVTATAAAVAGTVIVAVDGAKSDTAPMALSAAEVLNKAADKSRADSADMPIPRNNQYIYTKTVYTRMYKDGKTKKSTAESWLSVDGSKTSRYAGFDDAFDLPPVRNQKVSWPPTEFSKLKAMPLDPDKLLEELRLGEPNNPTGNRVAFAHAAMLLRGPQVMPPGLQAAAFEAVAKLPGIIRDNDAVDALGRHGIGITYPKLTFTMIFDRDTFGYLGLSQNGIAGGTLVGKDMKPLKPTGNGKTIELGAGGRTIGGKPFTEVQGLEKMAVVDNLGQRP